MGKPSHPTITRPAKSGRSSFPSFTVRLLMTNFGNRRCLLLLAALGVGWLILPARTPARSVPGQDSDSIDSKVIVMRRGSATPGRVAAVLTQHHEGEATSTEQPGRAF